jgi:hypothetical protein
MSDAEIAGNPEIPQRRFGALDLTEALLRDSRTIR